MAGEVASACHLNGVSVILLKEDLHIELGLGIIELIDGPDQNGKHLGLSIDRHEDGVDGEITIVKRGELLRSDLDFQGVCEGTGGELQLEG